MVALILAGLVAATPVGVQSPTPVGIRLQANGHIRVEICSLQRPIVTKIVWFRWPNDAHGRPLVDFENPNLALRTRPLLGLTILQGLRRTGDRTWKDVKIYNPDGRHRLPNTDVVGGQWGLARSGLFTSTNARRDTNLDSRSLIRAYSRNQAPYRPDRGGINCDHCDCRHRKRSSRAWNRASGRRSPSAIPPTARSRPNLGIPVRIAGIACSGTSSSLVPFSSSTVILS